MKPNEQKRERERDLELEIKKKYKGDIFWLEEQHENFLAAVTKGEKVAATQSENERQWKRSEREHVRHFLRKTCNFWKFHVVVVQNNGKEMHKTSVRVQSCFFAH